MAPDDTVDGGPVAPEPYDWRSEEDIRRSIDAVFDAEDPALLTQVMNNLGALVGQAQSKARDQQHEVSLLLAVQMETQRRIDDRSRERREVARAEKDAAAGMMPKPQEPEPEAKLEEAEESGPIVHAGPPDPEPLDEGYVPSPT